MSSFPVVALLLFGALCLVAILMLVIISQQEKYVFHSHLDFCVGVEGFENAQ